MLSTPIWVWRQNNTGCRVTAGAYTRIVHDSRCCPCGANGVWRRACELHRGSSPHQKSLGWGWARHISVHTPRMVYLYNADFAAFFAIAAAECRLAAVESTSASCGLRLKQHKWWCICPAWQRNSKFPRRASGGIVQRSPASNSAVRRWPARRGRFSPRRFRGTSGCRWRRACGLPG